MTAEQLFQRWLELYQLTDTLPVDAPEFTAAMEERDTIGDSLYNDHHRLTHWNRDAKRWELVEVKAKA